MTYKKGSCAEFGPVDVLWFKSDSVKPFSCIRIKVIMIIIIILTPIAAGLTMGTTVLCLLSLQGDQRPVVSSELVQAF